MQQINFSALPKSRSTNNFQKRKIPSLFKIIFLFFGVMASVFVVLAGAVVLLPLFWVAIGFMIIVGYRSTSTTRSNYSKFAADNNWVEWGKVPPQPIMESIGYLFISTYLSGLLDERKFWICHILPPGQSSDKTIDTAIIIELEKVLPTLVISAKHGIFTELSPLQGLESLNLKRLRLEGDFDEWLQLFVRPGQELEALSYITPEVMAVFVDSVVSKVTFVDNYMYIQGNLFNSVTQEAYKKGFSETQLILKEILEKQRYNLS